MAAGGTRLREKNVLVRKKSFSVVGRIFNLRGRKTG